MYIYDICTFTSYVQIRTYIHTISYNHESGTNTNLVHQLPQAESLEVGGVGLWKKQATKKAVKKHIYIITVCIYLIYTYIFMYVHIYTCIYMRNPFWCHTSWYMLTHRLKLGGRPVHHLTCLGGTFPKNASKLVDFRQATKIFEGHVFSRTKGMVGFLDWSRWKK